MKMDNVIDIKMQGDGYNEEYNVRPIGEEEDVVDTYPENGDGYPEANDEKKKKRREKFYDCVKSFWKEVFVFYAQNTFALVITFLYVAIFSAVSLIIKFENEAYVKVNVGPPLAFHHPLSQTLFVFLGMFGNLLLSLINSLLYFFGGFCFKGCVQATDPSKKTINIWLFMIPAAFNTTSTILFAIGFLLTYASIVTMMRSGVVLTTFVLSIFLLKKTFWKFPHKWLGVFLVLGGVVVIGVDMIVNPQGEGQATAGRPFLGVIFVLCSVVFNSFQFISEEWLLTGYNSGPLQVAGLEGMWGVFFMTVILFFCYFIPGGDYGSLENLPMALAQIFSNWVLFLDVGLTIPLFMCFFIVANLLMKYYSGATRAIVNQIPPVVVWIVQVVRKRQDFEWLQLVGYIIIVSGIFIYFEVAFQIIVPFYWKWIESMKKKEKVGKGGKGGEEGEESEKKKKDGNIQSSARNNMK